MTVDAPATRPAVRPAAAAGDTGQARFLTGEAVHLDVRVARLGSRVLARLIDIIIQIVLAYALLLLFLVVLLIGTAFGLVFPDDAAFSVIQIVMLVTVFIGYPVMMETLLRGRTMGKLAM